MAKILDSSINVCKFERSSPYYINFRTNIHGKGMKTLISAAMGLIVLLLFL